MAVVSQVSVGSEGQATVLAAPSGSRYQFIAIGNNGGSVAYIKFMPDGGDVTTGNGIPLPAGSSMLVDQDDSPVLNNGIFAICAEGQSTSLAVQAY